MPLAGSEDGRTDPDRDALLGGMPQSADLRAASWRSSAYTCSGSAISAQLRAVSTRHGMNIASATIASPIWRRCGLDRSRFRRSNPVHRRTELDHARAAPRHRTAARAAASNVGSTGVERGSTRMQALERRAGDAAPAPRRRVRRAEPLAPPCGRAPPAAGRRRPARRHIAPRRRGARIARRPVRAAGRRPAADLARRGRAGPRRRSS